MIRLKAFRVRLCPTAEQATQINRTIGSARYVYNSFLARRQAAYREEQKSLGYGETSAELTVIKKQEETLWLREVDKFALQNSLKDLDRSYQKFFRDCQKPKRERKFGYPNFHSKKGSKQSYRTNLTNGNIVVLGDRLKLPKLGRVKFRRSQDIVGKILSVTVKRSAAGQYHATVQVEQDIAVPEVNARPAVGLDLGLKSLLVTSDGETIDNPRHYRSALKRLRRAQRTLARRQKGSGRRQRAKTKLARVHERIRNVRQDMLHKLTTRLVRTYGTICIETLRITNMVRNHCLALSIMDVSWGELTRQLTYKTQWAGTDLVKVDAFFPSSQKCHDCGFRNAAVKDLKVREWTCPNCGETHDRDLNAALNIRDEGLNVQRKTLEDPEVKKEARVAGKYKTVWKKLESLPVVDGGQFALPASQEVLADGTSDSQNAHGVHVRPENSGSARRSENHATSVV